MRSTAQLLKKENPPEPLSLSAGVLALLWLLLLWLLVPHHRRVVTVNVCLRRIVAGMLHRNSYKQLKGKWKRCKPHTQIHTMNIRFAMKQAKPRRKCVRKKARKHSASDKKVLLLRFVTAVFLGWIENVPHICLFAHRSCCCAVWLQAHKKNAMNEHEEGGN